MSQEESRNIARHTVKGSAYSMTSSVVTLTLGIVRVTLMARLLLPETVGLGALGLLFLDMASQIGIIGIHSAFIHRQAVDDKVRATYFTLNLGLTAVSLAVLGLFLPLIVRFYPDYPQLGLVILASMGSEVIKAFTLPQIMGLRKNLEFGRLAVLDVCSGIAMTIVGPLMAWWGFGVWSIIGEQFSGILVRSLIIWLLFRPWRARLGWDWEVGRWFWNYGVKAWWSTNLTYVLTNFDEFWIGSYPTLRASALGLYAKAYDYATYSRKVVATPILSVFFPTFAHLQSDRIRLSRAFFRATSLMVRVGCVFSLAFISTAPEFIQLFIGAPWLPMQTTFQLMIVYTLLDPLNQAAKNLLMATGLPEVVLRASVIQTVIFIPAVILLSRFWGIEGVALATDLMILAGAVVLFRDTYRVTDYSSRALWLWPLLAMIITGGVVFGMGSVWAAMTLWLALFAKLTLIGTLYGGILFIAEREQMFSGWNFLWEMMKPRIVKPSA